MQDWAEEVATTLVGANPEVETAKDCFLFWDGLIIGMYLAMTYPHFSQKLFDGMMAEKPEVALSNLAEGLAALVESIPEPL